MFVKLGAYPECACGKDESELEDENIVECGELGDREEIIQIDEWDTWSLDATLSKIIAPALIQLRDTTHGYPSAFEKFEDWVDALNKMIFAHEAIAAGTWEDQFFSGESDISWEPVEEFEGNDDLAGSRRMVIGPNDTFKFDKEGHAEYAARIQEGLELFGKYYLNLWD